MYETAKNMADRLSIIEINDSFGYCLDHNDLAGFLSLFADDIVYVNAQRTLNGKPELEAFFTARAENGRVSRHLYSGLRIAFSDENHASATSVWLTFAGSGALPLTPAEPFAVADITDTYARTENGRWVITERRITPIFLSKTIPQLPSTREAKS